MQLEWRLSRYLAPLVGILFIPQVAFGAQFLFSPASTTCPVGGPCAIKVLVDPGSDSINAGDGTVTYDTSLLDVDSISKDGSVFTLWTSDPTYSGGVINFSGGSPGKISSQGTVITINFKPLAVGVAKLSFTKGDVLAADGKGTNVYKGGQDTTVTINTAAPPDAPPADNTGNGADVPDTGAPGATEPAPQLTSDTFPKPDGWYATSTGKFSWKLLSDVTGVRILVSQQDNQTPNKNLKATDSSTTVTGIPDGVSYFYVQFKNDSGWGDIAKRMVQIDTVPPEQFDVALVNGDTPKFSFTAKDDLSGIDRYEIILGSTSAATIKESDMTDGTTPVPPQPGGPTLVTIKAYDKAGNVTASQKMFTLPKVDPPKKAGDTTAPVAAGTPLWETLLLVALAIGIGGLATLNYYAKKNAQSEKSHILDEVSAVRDKNDKIFSAMREEFEAMINDFDPKPQLTPQERDLLENIKEVLEVSEELVDSSMEELKKIVHGN